MRARTLIAYGVVLYSMAGTPGAAQCGGGLLWLGHFATDSSVTALFSGTVTDVRQSGLRGNVIDLERYVVVAHHLTAVERAQVGAEQNPDALITEMCGGGSRPFELAAPELFDDLGAGWAPR